MGCNDGRRLRREDIPSWIEVDAEGRVWTTHDLAGWPDKPRRRAERWNASTRGYGTVALGAIGVHLAHRIVYAWHHGEAPAGVLVLHGNHTRSDNRPENLRLGTAAENSAEMAEAGRSGGEKREGVKNCNAKMTPERVRAMRAEYAAGATQTALAEQYGLRQATVWAIVNQKTWRHVEAA
jgi:hypothetical protein